MPGRTNPGIITTQMKRFFLAILAICGITMYANAQFVFPDSCKVTGYFFNNATTTSSRAINMKKALTQVAPNRYEVILGDLVTQGYTFQFDINANNQLVNWVATGITAVNVPPPASGFMTMDDPGNFFEDFTFDNQPGFLGWDIGTYNNTYDSVTHTLYMHYGYGSGSTGEDGYTRQVYEKWQIPPRIFSFTPASGTSLTEVTIKGQGFSSIDTSYTSSVVFGASSCDSFAIISDTIVKAWIGFGNTGKISVRNAAGTDSSADIFTYTYPPAITDTQWRYLGSPGFSDSWTPFVNLACGSNNIPYVTYRDSLTKRAIVKKYDGSNWVAVGSFVSDGSCALVNLTLDNSDNPVVVYQDSLNNNGLTVKRFNGSSWTTLGAPGFAVWYPLSPYMTPSIAKDGANNLYVMSVDTFLNLSGNTTFAVSVYKYNGSNWSLLGSPKFAETLDGVINLTVDKLTNTPYVVYDIFEGAVGIYSGQSSVKKYDGTDWVQVGQPRITTTAWRGTFYNVIGIDRLGVPYIAMQDDNGFERESVYKFTGGTWIPVGSPRFSKGHTNYSSIALDTSNNPIVLYRDYSYNRSGSVLKWDNTGSWKYLGERGVIPSQSFDIKSLAVNNNNIPMIAFADYRHGGRISVMVFIDSRIINDSLCANGNISLHSDNTNTGNTYRWQVDNGTGYVNVTNNATYTGATTNTLNILAVPTAYTGYKYRCIIQNGVAIDTGHIHTLHFSNTWTGAVSNAWENPANWSCNVVPDANTDVVINSGTIVISSNAIIRTLYTGIGVSLTVSTGFNFTVLH